MLVELMMVVAIIAVSASLALFGYVRWQRTARTAEATSMLLGIAGQQDTYRAETLKFLDCTNGGRNLGQHYPVGVPSGTKQPFDLNACGSDPVCTSFRKLNVQADSQVYYVYSCAAGPADGTDIIGLNGRRYGPANDVWHITRAVGDLDADGQQGVYETSSTAMSVWSANSDE
jgi:type II secretory pathway pseudopilin PulG